MRRIIERVVTVVTTTTWKISWEADPSPADPSLAAGEARETEPTGQEESQRTLPSPTTVETKEVDGLESKDINGSSGG